MQKNDLLTIGVLKAQASAGEILVLWLIHCFINSVKTLGSNVLNCALLEYQKPFFGGIPERLCFWQIWIFAQLRLAHQTGAFMI